MQLLLLPTIELIKWTPGEERRCSKSTGRRAKREKGERGEFIPGSGRPGSVVWRHV